MEKTSVSCIDSFFPRDLVETLSACARLAVTPGKTFLSAGLKRARDVADRFSQSGTLELVYALAIIDAGREARQLPNRPDISKNFESLINRQAFRRNLAAECASDSASVAAISAFRDTAFWFARHDESTVPYPKNDDTESLFERDVARLLEQHEAIMLPTKPHPVTRKRRDLKATFASAAFSVECDGPSHFVRDADSHTIMLNGQTIFQAKLDAIREPEERVLHVPFALFYATAQDNEMWEEVLLHITDAKPGAYIVSPAGQILPIAEGVDPGRTYDNGGPGLS
ncbi:MAG: hypothetical protein EOM26_06700 [Alphaproteobacteria bacterium]|nr:hypothetical protein [Alphaproteobacteria bacterium]